MNILHTLFSSNRFGRRWEWWSPYLLLVDGVHLETKLRGFHLSGSLREPGWWRHRFLVRKIALTRAASSLIFVQKMTSLARAQRLSVVAHVSPWRHTVNASARLQLLCCESSGYSAPARVTPNTPFVICHLFECLQCCKESQFFPPLFLPTQVSHTDIDKFTTQWTYNYEEVLHEYYFGRVTRIWWNV